MSAPEFPPGVAEQAVQWLVELHAHPGDEVLRRRWQQWYEAAPEHERAWRHIETTNRRLAGLPATAAAALLERPRSPGRRQALRTLAVFALLGAGGWALYGSGALQRWPADYATGVGRRRRIRLDDGSEVQLNTDSAIDVDFDPRERRIRLRRGEILVHSGHDPRPLRVLCAAGSLQPLGTRFLVRELPQGIRVGVQEGRVRVRYRAGAGLDLEAGRQLEFDRERIGAPLALEAGSGSWAEGMLSVSGMRLDAFLAELSRYRHGRLDCAPEVAGLRISGSFPLDQDERILATLPAVLPVRLRQRTRYWVSVLPR